MPPKGFNTGFKVNKMLSSDSLKKLDRRKRFFIFLLRV